MLILEITCIIVLPVLLLVLYVVHRSKPGRFRLKTSLHKLVSIEVEVDALDKPGELPPGSPPRTGGI